MRNINFDEQGSVHRTVSLSVGEGANSREDTQEKQQQRSVALRVSRRDGKHMPKFFFHLYDDQVALDPEGRELADVATAKEKAVEDARAIACAEVIEGHLGLNHRIEVTDANDVPVATITFKDAVKLHP